MIAENTTHTNEKQRIGNNTSLCIQSADLDEIQKFYNSSITDERVRIIIPLGKNIFSKAYGIIEDPFGIQMQLMYDDRLKQEIFIYYKVSITIQILTYLYDMKMFIASYSQYLP